MTYVLHGLYIQNSTSSQLTAVFRYCICDVYGIFTEECTQYKLLPSAGHHMLIRQTYIFIIDHSMQHAQVIQIEFVFINYVEFQPKLYTIYLYISSV